MMLAKNSVQKFMVSICLVEVLAASYFIIAPFQEVVPSKVSLPKRENVLQGAPFFMPPPSETFSSINERPLFNPLRTPIKSDALPTDGSGAEAVPSVVVVGVLIDRHTKMAFLKSQNTMFATTVEVGSVLGGWEVTDIAEDHVTIRNGSSEHEIPLNSVRNESAVTRTAIPSALKPLNGVQAKPIPDQTGSHASVNPPVIKPGSTLPPSPVPLIPAAGNDPQARKN